MFAIYERFVDGKVSLQSYECNDERRCISGELSNCPIEAAGETAFNKLVKRNIGIERHGDRNKRGNQISAG